jgi:hypothetical protein
VDPNGELLVETLYPIAVATIDEAVLGSARRVLDSGRGLWRFYQP